MNDWCRKLVLALALAVMPLQGVAATLTYVLCRGNAQAHAFHASAGHDQGVQHDSQQDQGGTPGNVFHPCCHYTVFAPAVVMLPAAQPDFPVRAFALDPLYDLFVPDQPQRPPLA